MIQLLFYFFELLSFKGSPSDAPYSPQLLAGLILVDIFLDALGNYGFGIQSGPAAALITPALIVAAMAGILTLRGTLPRLLQTLTAYFGAVIPLNILSLGLALGYHASNKPQTGTLAAFFGLGLLCMLLWHTALITHILRASANWLAVQALPAAVALTFFVAMTAKLLLPAS
jgi:hypothetical protein